jgi:DNA-binding MarR family transcriptional regulator
VPLTKTRARPALAGTSIGQVEDLMAELRRLSLGSTSAWSDTELTLTQLRALAVIQLHQPMTIGALSAALRMSLASGSALADRLVRAGLLERHHDTDDRRQVLLELAPSAMRFLRRIEVHSRARLRRAVAAIEPHEREALGTALGAFIRVLREGSGSVS